jgi:hypothetical protein
MARERMRDTWLIGIGFAAATFVSAAPLAPVICFFDIAQSFAAG